MNTMMSSAQQGLDRPSYSGAATTASVRVSCIATRGTEDALTMLPISESAMDKTARLSSCLIDEAALDQSRAMLIIRVHKHSNGAVQA
jgi:hypothetical protein